MRGMKALAGAAVLVALAGITASVRADDYNKMMTFTFNNSVQIPGATLEPGTYVFKLADPESGRRTVQVWDKDGKKMYTMALTMVDRRNEVAADPTKFKDGLVMFSEAPAGEPQAVRTWFYTGDTIGYEFVYPKDQAEKIAKAYHTPVLAMNDGSSSDAAALRGARVGRIDENGQFTDDSNSVTAASTTTADSASTTTATAADTQSAPASLTASANRTPPASSAASDARSADTTTTANSTTSTTASAAPAPQAATPSANRTPPSSAAPQTAAADQEPRPVGTAGQTAPRQTDTTQTAAATLPKTASPLATMELMSGLLLIAGLGVRQLRRRYADN